VGTFSGANVFVFLSSGVGEKGEEILGTDIYALLKGAGGRESE